MVPMKRHRMNCWAKLAIWMMITSAMALAAVCWVIDAQAIGEWPPEERPRPYRDLETGEIVWPENGYSWATIIGTDVNVRRGPGLNHQILFQLSNGSAVEVFGVENGWYKCLHWSIPGEYVYVYSDFAMLIAQ